MEAPPAQPVAVAEIHLSEDERKRIAKDLQLDESQLDAVPKKLDIARFADDDIGDDVSGFLMNAFAAPKSPTTVSPRPAQPAFPVGRIPGGLLVPQ